MPPMTAHSPVVDVVGLLVIGGEKPYSCLEGGKCFIEKGNLNRHKQSSEKPKNSHRCSECGKCFTQNGNLHGPLRIHTGECNFSSSECGKDLYDRGKFHRHQKAYTECGKTFHGRKSLQTHLKLTDEKPCSCSECGKCF
ncbi:gastrula zinc finger protein XlCGF7.1-like [Hyperolius riggenbachi]|uniref:gastrula zinc finger protein XlCGF7.1-like n=1 Tax=Hyperolius riggenbachi TaxID=752182 RepID=UPI0035A28DD2